MRPSFEEILSMLESIESVVCSAWVGLSGLRTLLILTVFSFSGTAQKRIIDGHGELTDAAIIWDLSTKKWRALLQYKL
jgi:hypothetical protein